MTGAEFDPRESSPVTAPITASSQHEDTTTDVQQPDPALLETVPPGHALLIIQRGPRAGERLPLEADRTLAGRHPEADILLDDITVSRKHAEFLDHNGGHMLRDVGSLNGTYVNGQRIDATALHAGDELQIGKYRLIYHPAPQSE